eukprot:15443955-Alexandrium_andersonii.AAC.1
MTRFWLSPGGPCRHEVNRFCNGTPRSDLSQLAQQELAKLFSLRSLKGALKLCAKMHGPVAASASIRGNAVLERMLRQTPECLPGLLQCIQRARTLSNIPSLLGIVSHPDVWQLQDQHNTKVVRLVSRIVYRCDWSTPFEDLSSTKHAHTRKRDQEKSDATKAAKHFGVAPVSYTHLRAHETSAHL